MRKSLFIAGLFCFLALSFTQAGQRHSTQGEKIRQKFDRARALGQFSIPLYAFEVTKTFPHDTDSFTQGLFYHGGVVYEGTGRYGKSRLIKLKLETGKKIRERHLDKAYFGEGVAVCGNRVFQLTYKEKTAFSYDLEDLALKQTYPYPRRGWGLASDGRRLVASDGTARLYFLDPDDFSQKGSVKVRDKIGPVVNLNELEFFKGRVLANVWMTDILVEIDPDTGRVVSFIDLTGLNPDPEKLRFPYVLNGIAVNEKNGRLLVTGKCWPHIYEIDLVRLSREKRQGLLDRINNRG